MKKWTLGELAKHVKGEVLGDPMTEIRSAATLEQGGQGDITFLANRKYKKLCQTTRAAAIVVKKAVASSTALLIAEDPYYAFAQIVILLHGHRPHPKTGVSNRASLSETAVIGKDSHIHDFAVVGDNARIGNRCVLYPGVFVGPDTRIGDDCIFYPNVVIYERCWIGNRVIIQANATVGEDGFGYATHDGIHHKIPHIGQVIVEDDVELGAGCAIERGTLDDTVIGKGSKLGDSVVIGHGTRIGPHCLLVAQVGVAGSTAIGHHCMAGGQVGITGHIKVGNQVMIAGQSGVMGNIPDGAKVFGTPAFDAMQAKRAYMLIRNLPDMWNKIKRLERQAAERDL